MRTLINNINESHIMQLVWSQSAKCLMAIALLLVGVQATAQEQQHTQPSWWFGAAAAANFNFYNGTTQRLTDGYMAPKAFSEGFGVGLYVAPLIEFHRPDSRWGVMLQAGYDNRKGKFDQVTTPCNCPADLSTDLAYVTIEPSLRLAPFKGNFYVYAGPRFAYNLNNSFEYKQGINPEFPDQIPTPDLNGEFSNTEPWLVSMQIGAGYDIPMMTENKRYALMFSPFVAFQPYLGQAPRSMETWNVTTLRVGAALKFGRGSKANDNLAQNGYNAPRVTFSVYSPKNIPVERRIRETFPLRNYVFFNLGETEIADRYVLISKNQVADFKEDQLEVFAPKRLAGRSAREMVVYYNILNILGDRLGKNPAATVMLSGASMEGVEDGMAMAESIKKYWVTVFGINPSRIETEGRIKPKLASEQPGATLELNLLREGDRRVTIYSNSPTMLMEFQSGPEAQLKPVQIANVQTAPLDSYVTFTTIREDEPFASWSLEIKDDKGIVQNFGPYTQQTVSIPGKSILGTKPEANYKVTMVGKTKQGTTIRKDAAADVKMVLWKPDTNEQGIRYSVLYEFNKSEAIAIYEKYLIEVVTPQIPKRGKVIIHGYTDIIGDAGNNKELSLARTNDVRRIISEALAKANRKDVVFEVHGFGEDEALAPFENTYPEERFYNRSVIIDIIPVR